MGKIGAEIIREYKKYITGEEKSAHTVEKYMRDIYEFYKWARGRNADKALMVEYKEHLKKKYKAGSVNSIISSLNSLFQYLGWHECKLKTLKIQKQIYADKSRELTKSEYERLLAAAKSRKNERLYYLMQTICATGIRVSELKFITVEAVRTGMARITNKGKMRTVFLPSKLCKMLKGYIKHRKIKNGSVFVTKNGKPLDRSNIWSDMKRLADEAGVARSKVFPHSLRHLFARSYYSVHKDIVRLADILGHASINTTRIYTRESGEVHRRQIEMIGLLRC